MTTGTNPAAEGDWTQTLTDSVMISLKISAFDDATVLPSNLLIHPGMSGGIRG